MWGGYTANAEPATNPAGTGDGVAVGAGSSAPKAENVAIGKEAKITYSNGASAATGDIVVGNDANINNYASQGGSIAIGKNAKIENMAGGGEATFALGQTTFNGSLFSSARIPQDPTKVVGSIAIGDNTFARTGSTMIGSHNYRGALGDTTVDSAATRASNLNVYATTIGANSFSNGAFTTTTGVYNIISGEYNGGRSANGQKNFGATVTGALNSVESMNSAGSGYYSGIANGVVGIANRTQNSNGALVFGAGNEITNSIDDISGLPGGGLFSTNPTSAKDLANILREAVKDSNGGGATLAIGGGNTADYTQASQMIGVNNTLKGTAGSKAAYSLLNGYKNTATNVQHVSVIGSENTVENSKSQIVMGDSNTIKNRNAGTNSGKQEERTKNVLDLTIGKGNEITGNDTYMKGHESLKVIGDHNSFTNPSAGIVIGDYQNLGTIKESVVIGSMSPDEKADTTIQQKHKSVVIGYHAQSGVETGGGMNVAVGHRAKAYGWMESVTGISSVIENGDTGYDGYLANIYGGLNKISAAPGADGQDGLANSIVGTLNQTSGASGALVMGAGNQITHSYGPAAQTNDNLWMTIQGMTQYSDSVNYDNLVPGMAIHMRSGSGSVSALGNGNAADYAIRSQIIGSGNTLKGADGANSENNNVTGYLNTGDKISNVSMIGMGNHVSDSKSDVVIGDYHKVTGGSNNVILGSMAYTERIEDKTYNVIDPQDGSSFPIPYKVTVYEPVKAHTANISNAVMLGYNTDVTKNGGVALGAESIASTDKGVAGYDPLTKAASAETSATWKATDAAVSVGSEADPTGAAHTRQITNVAAGANDTDAVNVAQLKQAVTGATEAAKTTIEAGENVTVEAGTTANSYKISAKDTTLKADTNALKLTGKTLSLNIEDTSGKKVTGSVDLTAVAGEIDTNTTYTMTGVENADNTTTITLTGSDGVKNEVKVASKDTRSTVKAGENVTITDKNNEFGAKEYTINVKTDGKVESGNTGIVSGGTVYNETHVKNDGTYVKKGNSAGDNLSVLDKQVSKNTDNITNLGNTIYNMNNTVGELGERINKVGAGAAALAGLHPLDFDPHDKWDIAAGFGNYRNASAAAVGLFYRPNERTMLNLGFTMGDSRNMVNAGVSVKLGRGDVYTKYSKVEMANRIEAQDKEIAALKAKDAERDAQMKDVLKQLEELRKGK